MSAPVIALALFAAILHATWNSFLRSGADRLWTITIMSISMVMVAVPFAFVLPLPPAAAWPWLVASSVLQVGYCCLLITAYRHGDLGQVYPVVRGSVPLLVTLGGYLFLSVHLQPVALIGIGLIAGGIMALATGKGRASPTSLAFAVLAGLFIAAYSLIDAKGVRVAGHAGSYAMWIYILFGTLMVLVFIAMRGRPRIDVRAPDTWKAVGGGMVSMAAYGAVVAALALGPPGPVTALRETSVIFAVLIGRAFLGERLTARRLIACVVVVAGAMCVGYAR